MSNHTLRVYLVHGTWNMSASWARSDSDFQQQIKHRLEYDDVQFRAIKWSGWNKSKARRLAATELRMAINEDVSNYKQEFDILIVGHSHGGNISTRAARELLDEQTITDKQLLGVVCLNTPFLTTELRASTSYTNIWMTLIFFLAMSVLLTMQFHPPLILDVAESVSKVVRIKLSPLSLAIGALFLMAPLIYVIHRTKRYVQDRVPQEANFWDRSRPRVLCLSAADDEAITILGLLEGIANLPQMLFHPLAVTVSAGAISGILVLQPGLVFCPKDPACYFGGAVLVGVHLVLWMYIAVASSVTGTAIISYLFGLSWKQWVEALVARTLVSYAPLLPSVATFRALTDLRVSHAPFQLIHSRIYESPVVFEEIRRWIESHVRGGVTSSVRGDQIGEV